MTLGVSYNHRVCLGVLVLTTALALAKADRCSSLFRQIDSNGNQSSNNSDIQDDDADTVSVNITSTPPSPFVAQHCKYDWVRVLFIVLFSLGCVAMLVLLTILIFTATSHIRGAVYRQRGWRRDLRDKPTVPVAYVDPSCPAPAGVYLCVPEPAVLQPTRMSDLRRTLESVSFVTWKGRPAWVRKFSYQGGRRNDADRNPRASFETQYTVDESCLVHPENEQSDTRNNV